jgi:hypothetical protein
MLKRRMRGYNRLFGDVVPRLRFNVTRPEGTMLALVCVEDGFQDSEGEELLCLQKIIRILHQAIDRTSHLDYNPFLTIAPLYPQNHQIT